jgi:hypothetical protein
MQLAQPTQQKVKERTQSYDRARPHIFQNEPKRARSQKRSALKTQRHVA